MNNTKFRKYIKNENIWDHLRIVYRKMMSVKLNRSYYIKSNRISKESYTNVRQKYQEYIEQLVERIQIASKNVERVENKKEKFGNTYLYEYKNISNIGDDMGRVIFSKGEYYRGIYKNKVQGFLKLWNTGILQGLSEEDLVPQLTISNYYTEEFPLILHIQKKYILKNTVWSYAMTRDACILVAVLKQVLNHFDYTLFDGHMNNLTFDKGKPVFIDIGSIIEYTPTSFQEETVFSGIYRLLFAFIGNSIMCRLPSHDENNCNIYVEPRRFDLMTREYQYGLKILKKYCFFHGNYIARKMVHRMFELYSIQPEDIDLLFPVYTKRVRKYEICYRDVCDVLIEFSDINDIAVLGGTSGYLELEIFKCYDNRNYWIKSLDFDERRLDCAYLLLRDKNKNVTTVLFNYLYFQSNNLTAQIISDLAICIDPIWNIYAYQTISISSIVAILRKLARRYILIVLYKKRDLPSYIRYTDSRQWMDEFELNFHRHFRLLKKLENCQSDDYVIYLGEAENSGV